MDRLLEATARAERDHFWFRGFRRFVTPLLDRAADGRGDLRALDCGCGTGHNLALLRRYGTAFGIDITWSGLRYAASQGERHVARASAASLPFTGGAFDLVTSFDVIYSLPDEIEGAVVGEMFRVLEPGGHLVLNAAALDALKGNHSVLSSEVRRYSKASLTRLLERAGFRILWMSYTNATILPMLLGVRLVQRISGHEESPLEITVPAAPVNLALSGLLALEAAALRFVPMPAGSSLLCLAQKPATGPS
ncbi:MAG: class I SAM-dependent methyltransferase [Acidobacteriota bacterium]|nr:class I SAM-dependent methyltransferase [Acidobacteriota bacterium]